MKAVFLDSNVRDLHSQFGPPLMSGEFSKPEERKYLSDAVGSMALDDQRRLLRYAAQQKRWASV